MGKYKNSISFEEGFCEIFNTEEDLKDEEVNGNVV